MDPFALEQSTRAEPGEAAADNGDGDVRHVLSRPGWVAAGYAVPSVRFLVRHRTVEYGTIVYRMQARFRNQAARRRRAPAEPDLTLSVSINGTDHRLRLVQGMA